MGYPKNYQKNCIIYDKDLWNDLKPYSITELGTAFVMNYTGSTEYSIGHVNGDAIFNIIDQNKPTLEDAQLEDIWLPAIVSNNSHIKTKEVLLGGVVGNKVLGIEEIVRFENVQLKNWLLESGRVDLCADWIINTNLSSYDVEYGVLCWYKKNTIHTNNRKYQFYQIQNGTRIKPETTLSYKIGNNTYTILTTDTIIKLDNSTVRLLDKDSSKFIRDINIPDNGSFEFNTSVQHQNLPVSTITDFSSKLFYVIDNINTLSDSLLNYDLYLSNGEFYSYFLGDKDKYDRQVYSTVKMPSRSYLSPSLYHIYRAIYNTLTIDRIRNLDGLGPLHILEKLKKLCYILSTSPLIDRVNINLLYHNDIKNIVSTYISADSKDNSTDEIKELLDTVAKIFQYYKQQSFFLQKQTLAHNYINNRTDLLKALSNKYGCYLKINYNSNTPTKIKYLKKIPAGSHGYIDIQMKSCVDKDFDPNVDIFNDMKIEFGKLFVETQMDPSLSPSGCIVKVGASINDAGDSPVSPKVVPLSNMAIRKIPENLLTVFNKDVNVQIETIGETKRIDNIVNISQGELEEELSERISYSWSLVDGPDCVRFSDFATNGNQDSNRRNRTSADFEPSLYVQQTGLYVLQGITTLGSTLKSIENIRLYVSDANNEYQPGKTVPALLNYSYPQGSEPKQYRAMCANTRQLAFNKNGLVWFIDSDMFICDRSYPAFPRDRRFVDQKINMALDEVQIPMLPIPTNELSKLKEPADIVLTFKPNNTTVKLYKIRIENMRDSSQNNSQCKSFYEPKLARQRDTNLNIQTGAARFYRINKSPSSVDVLDHEFSNNVWKRNKYVSFELPDVSTVNAPPIVSYGGYSQSVIQNIGVEIPFHPITIDGEIESYRKIPSNKYWGTKLDNPTSPESGLIASAPASLPELSTHNYMGGADPNIRCHLVNIPVTGYTTFHKGYFHPNSGWYSYDVTSYNPEGSEMYKKHSATSNPNISAVKKFKTEKYKSYTFEGAGFYDIRSNNTEISSSNNNSINRPILYKSSIQIIPYSEYNIPWDDQDPNYGIRNWNGINYRDQELTDDFVITKEREALNEFICDYEPVNKYVLRNTTAMNDLVIEDLEVKINHINIANLKNVIFSLEIYNPELDTILSNNKDNNKNTIFLSFGNSTDRTEDPESWIDRVGVTEVASAPILSFIKKHKETNTLSDKPNTRVVYLYNQESLDNLSYHFSLCFSDNFSKHNTFADENKISLSGVGRYNEPINHDGILSPCVSPAGYSEKDSLYFRQILKNNNIQLLDGSLSQFKKIPLRNTKFTLVSHVLGPEENIQSLDNTVSSSYLSGLSSYSIKQSSNSITNSICSWHIIAHTSKTPKFTTQDYLGSLDYEADKISTTGYNFIADMTDREYLIPKVNLNAPYDYIVTNKCDYINNNDLSKPLTYDRIQFPYIGAYTPTFFTLVGTLVEIQIIAIKLATGGRGDPLINMLLDIRFQRQQQEQEREYYKPVYNGTYLGVANKALIQASKDGYNWYRMEVPIFKYDNTAILGKNKYKYIKLHKGIATGFSNFVFNKVTKMEDLLRDEDIVYTSTTNLSLSGLTINLPDQTIHLQEYDIVRVTAQTDQTANGIYYAKKDSWSRFSPLSPKTIFKNKIFGNNSITYTSISENKIIIVRGSRAYNLFDENDTIAIMTKPAAETPDADLFSGVIDNKALLYLNDGLYTVFTLKQAIPNNMSEGFISKDLTNSNWLMIYKDHATYFDDSEFGKWGLSKSTTQKSHINKGYSNEHSVATSEGAIGYGSNYLQPDIYSDAETSHPNKIVDMDSILNNRDNDKIKFNTIVALQYSDNTIKNISFSHEDTNKQLLTAYPYRYEDAEYNLDSLYNYSTIYASGLSAVQNQTLVFSSGIPLSGIRLENLKKSLKNSLSNNNTDYYFIDLKSDKFKSDITSVSGELSIENDYIRTYPQDLLSNDDVTKISNRLLSLNSKSTTPPPANTINLNTISSIYDLQIFYNGLPTDPSGCFKKGYYNDADRLVYCSGSIAQQKLSSLKEERKQLTDILQSHKIRASGQGKGVLPYSMIELSENTITKEITIKNKKKNYYIIDIDHNQQCSLSNDATIKILDKITYTCEPVVEFYEYPECDAVCKSSDVISGPDESISTAGGASIRYVNEKANQQKTSYETQYPGIIWSSDPLVIEKVFFLSCENNVRETLVKVREEYIVPKQSFPIRGKVGQIFDLQNNKDIKIKFRNIPRKIKGIDPNYTRYIYDYYGRLGEDIIPPPGGPVNNDFYAWQCIKTKQPSQNDQYPNQTIGEFVDPPDFYKWMNEMIFRGFFGSVDGVENKNTDIMDSKEPHEWIPYEYF